MRLSKRLQAVANLVQGTDCVADVGTDHGWIPIYLVRQGQCQRAIAMDVRPGPLMRAKEHILQHNLEHLIETRLSDGVSALKEGEAHSVVIAGMGGNLTIHILEQGESVISSMQECILQPQSEVAKVRSFLRERGWPLLDEDMIYEGGKFYPMMRTAPCEKAVKDNSVAQGQAVPYARQIQEQNNFGQEISQEQRLIFDRYGSLLLLSQNPILYQYLLKEKKKTEEILMRLKENRERNSKRIQELEQDKHLIGEAMRYFDI